MDKENFSQEKARKNRDPVYSQELIISNIHEMFTQPFMDDL